MSSAHVPVLESLARPAVLAGIIMGTQALAVVLALAPDQGDRWVALGVWSLLLQWVSLGSTGLLYVLRRPLGRLPLPALGVTALLILALTGLVTGGLVGQALAGDGDRVPSLVWRLPCIALAVGAIGMLSLLNHWRARHYATQAKQAEIDALHARVRPHFLFNTLNAAASLVRARPAQAESALLDLADLFRAAISDRAVVPLERDIALGRQYLAIEALRFGDRLCVQWDLPDQIPEAWLPPLSLQPLLENAVHHGVERSAAPSTIRIAVSAVDGRVQVEVTNPLPDGIDPRPRHGIGLEATRSRLREAHQNHPNADLVTQHVNDTWRAVLTVPTWSPP